VAGAARYRAQIAGDFEFHAILADRVSPAAEAAFSSLPDGQYWLRVRSVDPDGLEGPDAVHAFDRHRLVAPPEPSEPLADAVQAGDGAGFRWAAAGEAVAYRFQLARDPGFSDLLVDRDRVASAGLRVDTVARGTYYWRVASIDGAGAAGPWSPAQRYRQKPLPGPITAANVTATSVELRWSGEPGQRFLVQVAREPDFNRVLDEQRTDAPQAALARHHAGAYYVRVQATDADGYVGPFTPPRQFFVRLPWWAIAAPLLLLIPLL
jgi:hypothetical protein